MNVRSINSTFVSVSTDVQKHIRSEVCRMRYEEADHSRIEHFGLRRLHLGPIDLIRYESDGIQRGTRTPDDIRRDRTDNFLVSIPVRSFLHTQQNGLNTDTGPDSLTILSSIKPFSGCIHGHDQDAFSFLQIHVPGPILRRHIRNADNLCNQPSAINSATGHILRSVLDTTLQHGAELEGRQADLAGMTVVDALVNAVSALSDRIDSTSLSQSSRQLITTRAKRFIEANLSDHSLDVPSVAEHCQVSERYLQRVFIGASSMSVASYIRVSRLQRCREALLDRRRTHRSVFQIALEWGFSDAAHFSRLYRTRFGKRPSQEGFNGS